MTKPEQRDIKLCPFCNKKLLQSLDPEWLEFDCDCLTVDEDGNIFIPNDIFHEYWTETRRTAVIEDEAVKGLVELLTVLKNHQRAKCMCDWGEFKSICKNKWNEIEEALSRFEEKHGKI